MHRELVNDSLYVVGKACAFVLHYDHTTLLSRVWFRVFGICSLCDSFWVSVIDVDLECDVLVGSTPYSGFHPNPVQPTAS